MARQEGIEPPTHSLEGCCSIQLSYWRFDRNGADRRSGPCRSGRPDLNRGPPAPKAGAIPGYATPREPPNVSDAASRNQLSTLRASSDARDREQRAKRARRDGSPRSFSSTLASPNVRAQLVATRNTGS